jgi:signal transduction histidine kinase
VDRGLSRQLGIFDRLARAAASVPSDVQEVLDRVAAEFRSAFSLGRAVVVRLERAERTVQAVVHQGLDWPADRAVPLRDLSFLERALDSGRAVFVRDARAESAMAPALIDRAGISSVVAVPLQVDDRCLGFLVGDRKGMPFLLAEDEVDLLSALGRVAAILVDKTDHVADFIAVASHELRTPIATVHGIAATLHFRQSALRDEQIAALRAALYQQTTRLHALTEQLLDLSKLDAGAFSVRPERFAPGPRLEAVLQHVAPERAADVRMAVDDRLELDTDPLAFERVASNLLENALRYGRPPIEVRVSNGAHVRLVVEDCGEGVDPAFVPRLFDRFTRDGYEPGAGGSGLGLAIASSYAKAIGGTLRYEPCQPHGARFTLELPAPVAFGSVASS